MENYEWPQYLFMFSYFINLVVCAAWHGKTIDYKLNFPLKLMLTVWGVFVLYMGGFF